MKELRFPEARSLEDLFSTIALYGRAHPLAPPTMPVVNETYSRGFVTRRAADVPIGPFCNVDLRASGEHAPALAVIANEELVAAVTRFSFCSSVNESISFAVIQQGNKHEECLVIAQNSQIIASQWLARIPTASVRRAIQLAQARALPNAELDRHASVSIKNRHRCASCFTCACVEVAAERAKASA